MAISIIYLISPPPNIILGIINNSITKKIRIVKEIITECTEIFPSKVPKITKNKNKVMIVIFGILYLVQSVYDSRRENI